MKNDNDIGKISKETREQWKKEIGRKGAEARHHTWREEQMERGTLVVWKKAVETKPRVDAADNQPLPASSAPRP